MVLSEILNPIIASTKKKQSILIFTIMVLDNELVSTVCDMANFVCYEEFDYCYGDIIFVWTIHESMSSCTSDNPNWGRMVSWARYHIQTIGYRSSEAHSATHCCGRHEITRHDLPIKNRLALTVSYHPPTTTPNQFWAGTNLCWAAYIWYWRIDIIFHGGQMHWRHNHLFLIQRDN